ncbi:CD2 antigen cytoplasmic tail-binding protein 2-like protein [Armadillidium vulgare]|nr:CD2 antigen cytoplasmic tail-binding protein 2-like protein [Armadillidium vulgare]
MHKKAQPGGYKYDDDEDYVPSKKVKYSKDDDIKGTHVKKHTLDSDEEDEDEILKAQQKKYDILKDEDIDGQEDATIDMEGETKITPFNMKEEMEEGHFDKDGFYHFKKEGEQLKDAWLDNIDWVKIKNEGDAVKKYGSDAESDSGDESSLTPIQSHQEKESLIEIYEEIFPFLREGESISKSLKRLSGNTKRLTSAERWKLKKQGKLPSENGGNMDEFLKLTELINKVILKGNMDIYQETYEMIRLKIERFRKPATSEPLMDMFSDDVKSAKDSQNVSADKDSHNASPDKELENSEKKDTFDEVKWEFKWENNDEADTHGPFTTQQMIKWKESDYFKKGVYVRKTSEQSGPWYLSSRIDFDLYV